MEVVRRSMKGDKNLEKLNDLEKLSDLYKRVEVNAGVLTVSMRDLKDLDGRKLGRNVREHIAGLLKKRGLGFVGEGASFDELPARETDTVRLYIKASQIGSVIDAVVLRGSPGDRRLRAIISDEDNASKLGDLTNRLRELVAEFDPESF